MIGSLAGPVAHKGVGHVIVEARGVGYKVFVTAETYQRLERDKETRLFTHLAIREDAHTLYGFETPDELSFFELLLTVSGIGPRSALAILSLEKIETLRSAVATGDASYLTKVSGIGRKNAEKIVLELRDKLPARDEAEARGGESAEVLDALHALGYGLREARDALKKVPTELTETGERLKAALKVLSSHK